MVRDDDVIDEDHEMSITDEDIIRITASEGIPARRVKALEFTRQASSFLLSEDFMNKFFRRFTETAFRHDPTSSFSQIFLPGKEVSEKFEDAQQALIPVQRVKEKVKEKEKEIEKETKPEEVKPPKQVGPEKEEAAEKAKTKETISEAGTAQASAKPEFSPTDWTDIKKFALKGDTLSMDPKGIAMPVTYDAHDANPKWERLDREVVRDLMKAVRDNGLGSPYFKQPLKGTFNIYDLTPFDLRSLATMILSDSQFILWEAKWRKILNDYRIKYQGGANAGFTVAQLASDPPLDSAARQASFLPRDVLTDIKDAARKAMVQIPPAGVTESLFTDVKQGPSEPFASFIDCLTQAVDRQVIDEGVKSHMIRCLAFANANPECKRVISAMPGQPTMAEILEACSKVGTPQHVATILGDQMEKAVKEAFANFQQRQCYKCGKPGHFKKDCPQITNNADSSDHCSACGRRKRRPARKQCKWRNSVRKLQEERGSSTRDDTSDGDDSRASSARGTIIGEQHSDALSRTICRIPSDPELLPPRAQCDLATSKVICFLDDNYAVIPTSVTGSSWKRQDFLIIGKDRSSVLGLVIYPSVISADHNDELTVLAKPHQPPLIIPLNTSIARAIALPPHAAEQVLPVLREQDPPSGIGGNTLCLQSEDAIVVSGPGEPTPPIIRHLSNSTRAKLKENPLVLVRNPESGQIEGPFKLITWGKGFVCVFTAKWLAAWHVKPYRFQTQAETDPKTGGREVGTQT
ncbi:hypothetical protein DUI87_00847 [Hirundo rustica rustica]|uniref:CCHC-type domain-containing protein n=1 Tax=Hirundo rustica rustica TaxID=333673 RepID=A0A3M0L4P4_HIRRU|nr:hypothetical protein DUI87_00847 [Hirundo rustica rustica]